MKRYLVGLAVCLTLVAVVPQSRACNPRACGASGGCPVPAPGARPVPMTPVRPGPASPVSVGTPGGGAEAVGDTEVVWDLPQAEKLRIREAVRLRTTPAPAPAPTRPVPTPAETPAVPDRVAQAVAAQKSLANHIARLMAKRAEVERWDSQAQEKFRRAFGTTDEQVRLRVLQRIDQQIQEGSRLLAALAENIRFDFYVSQKKR